MNGNSPWERQRVYTSIVTILGERKQGNLGASRAEIQRATGLSRRQMATALQWLKRFGLAHNESKNFWTASPGEDICWKHGDSLKEGLCPTCSRNPKN